MCVSRFTGAVCALSILVGELIQAAQPLTNNSLVGTWKLVSVRHGMENTVGYPDLFNHVNKQTLKHVTPTDSVTVTYLKDGSIFAMSGGTFTVDTEKLTETVEYGIDPFKKLIESKGKITYDLILRGNTLHLTMHYGDNEKREELWERIERKTQDTTKQAKPIP